ncbi:hypothetical protein XAC2852_580229 [Xanthomonas citri pv. citri]|uniref:Uncharacterized protein n=1 Tax=Xanthomonas citri pv. citri TaxID=611301 RepID=A0A0U5FGJ3_XANCI|nr:hypothetical protein XAC9322_530224 [Xanthomonas citri pv. citri]CEE45960.1 hypothetical protein XAC2911_610047 [Xanthomonas citri pv. citri]CEE47240.1 hypothetical protein XAC908_770226 [Xanthomonas citri pv. citri]CEE50428.1 hypothetical protein XACS584_1000042 [Xanthomonas citri pv. citri]CEE66140.1 hypothetical protein XAC71A_760020 [Xanthomonas citri pv. citri]
MRSDGETQAAVLEAEGRKEAAFRDAERANVWPRPRHARCRWCPTPSPTAACRRSTVSSHGSMWKHSRRWPPRPTRNSC